MSDDIIDTPADRALARVRAAPDDQAAWASFYTAFRPNVAARLYRWGVGEDLKDLIQEVFYRFLRYSPWRHDWSTLPSRKTLAAYLRRIADRTVLSRARGASHRPQEEQSERLEDLYSAFPSQANIERMIGRLFHDLEQRDGDLLRLLVQGTSLPELAQRYEISYAAAAVRVNRLKRRVKVLLSSY